VSRNGYIGNPCRLNKIRAPWNELVTGIVGVYRKMLKDTLHSVYVGGSVACGRSIPNESDIDTLSIVKSGSPDGAAAWIAREERALAQRYPFAVRVELGCVPLASLFSEPWFGPLRFLVKTRSVCVFGTNVIPMLQPCKPGPEAIVHAYDLRHDIAEFNAAIRSPDNEVVLKECRWLMKRMIRVGFELVMQDECMYTRDLSECCRLFSVHYPEYGQDMRIALRLVAEPTREQAKLRELVGRLGTWLCREVDRVLPTCPWQSAA
jgi:hypothetical protein